MNRTLTLLACTALVLGALAVPVAANDGDEDHNERHEQAADRRDGAADKKADRAGDANRTEGNHSADDRRQKAQDRRADAMERKDAMREQIKERQDTFREARDACKAMKDEQKEARHNMTGNATEMNGTDGNETRNGTMKDDKFSQGHCVSMAAHDKHAKFARAAHYEGKMLESLEKRLAKLDVLEARVQTRIDSGDLNETEMVGAEAKLERIDAAQAKLSEKLEALRERQAAHQAAAEPADEPADDDAPAADEAPSGNATTPAGNGTA